MAGTYTGFPRNSRPRPVDGEVWLRKQHTASPAEVQPQKVWGRERWTVWSALRCRRLTS